MRANTKANWQMTLLAVCALVYQGVDVDQWASAGSCEELLDRVRRVELQIDIVLI